jgi:uncharacterized protein (DUF2147 family)
LNAEMIIKKSFFLSILLASSFCFAGELTGPLTTQLVNQLTGKWKTIDDETDKPKSIVEIYQEGDEFKGKITELFNPTKPNPVCEKCVGDKKDKPIIGMEIISGMKETKKGEEWAGGEIMDPKNGKSYKCRIRLKDDGKKLEVRGFIGFSLLGRSQTWIKEP